jgi:hypothetical protein
LALRYDLHQLIVAFALNGGLKGTYGAVQAGALDVGDHFVYDTHQFLVVVCLWQNLNGNTCFHKKYSPSKCFGGFPPGWVAISQKKSPIHAEWGTVANI